MDESGRKISLFFGPIYVQLSLPARSPLSLSLSLVTATTSSSTLMCGVVWWVCRVVMIDPSEEAGNVELERANAALSDSEKQ